MKKTPNLILKARIYMCIDMCFVRQFLSHIRFSENFRYELPPSENLYQDLSRKPSQFAVDSQFFVGLFAKFPLYCTPCQTSLLKYLKGGLRGFHVFSIAKLTLEQG